MLKLKLQAGDAMTLYRLLTVFIGDDRRDKNDRTRAAIIRDHIERLIVNKLEPSQQTGPAPAFDPQFDAWFAQQEAKIKKLIKDNQDVRILGEPINKPAAKTLDDFVPMSDDDDEVPKKVTYPSRSQTQGNRNHGRKKR